VAIEEIKHRDYAAASDSLQGLPFEVATQLRGLLACKYYAYLDKAIQCKKAIKEYEQTLAKIRAACEPGALPEKLSFSLVDNKLIND